MDSLIMVRHGRYDKKALLVVTDGMDNASQATLQQVVAQARRMGVLIYSIGIGDPNSGGVGIAIGPFMFGGDLYRVDTQTLTELSTESGIVGEPARCALFEALPVEIKTPDHEFSRRFR